MIVAVVVDSPVTVKEQAVLAGLVGQGAVRTLEEAVAGGGVGVQLETIVLLAVGDLGVGGVVLGRLCMLLSHRWCGRRCKNRPNK